jgi:phage-related tail fiber protein
MTNLVEAVKWEDGIYQLETSDPVEGGPDGIDNLPLRQLANRTRYLKDKQELHAAANNPHPQYATHDELQGYIQPGALLPFATKTVPSGWLKCNGAPISRQVYAVLFAAIGVTYGAGDGATTFNLPDLRGEYLRGWDDSRGIDSGRAFGSWQGDAMRNITGMVDGYCDFATASGAFGRGNPSSPMAPSGTGSSYHQLNFDASRQVPVANEFRTRNVAVQICIKY